VSVCLFNDDAYHLLHLGDDEEVLEVEGRSADGRLVGTASGVVSDGTWTSGHRAPFGGFDLARDWATPTEVGTFVDDVLAELRRRGLVAARVRTKPTSWSAAEPLLQQALLTRGFVVEQAELNFHIDVGTRHADGYAASLKKEARKALHRAQGLGLDFSLLDDPATWDEAFTVLRANRESKGRPMNLDLDELRRLAAAFGDRIRMVVLRHGDAVVAAALLYRADPGREVVVRWGDHGHELPHSPMYLLAERVVDLVGSEGATRLDLGISTDGGVPNPGLVQFKRAVGADAELRLDLVRRW
jgi:hypothetical protein